MRCGSPHTEVKYVRGRFFEFAKHSAHWRIISIPMLICVSRCLAWLIRSSPSKMCWQGEIISIAPWINVETCQNLFSECTTIVVTFIQNVTVVNNPVNVQVKLIETFVVTWFVDHVGQVDRIDEVMFGNQWTFDRFLQHVVLKYKEYLVWLHWHGHRFCFAAAAHLPFWPMKFAQLESATFSVPWIWNKIHSTIVRPQKLLNCQSANTYLSVSSVSFWLIHTEHSQLSESISSNSFAQFEWYDRMQLWHCRSVSGLQHCQQYKSCTIWKKWMDFDVSAKLTPINNFL